MKKWILIAALVSTVACAAAKIQNADVKAGAAIAYSKLNLAASIVNADIAAGAAIAYSKLNLAASIVNADIVNATIDLTTKVTGTLPKGNGGTGQTTYTDGQLLIGNSSGNTLTKATLTAGTNVTITNGNGSITIDAASGTPTTYAYAATFDSNCGNWSGTSTSYADPSIDTSCTITVNVNSNMGTVTAAGGSNSLPGLTWTPPVAGVYEMCTGLNGNLQSSGTNDVASLRLWDSTNSVLLGTSLLYKQIINQSNSAAVIVCGAESLTTTSTTWKWQYKVAGTSPTFSVDTGSGSPMWVTLKLLH